MSGKRQSTIHECTRGGYSHADVAPLARTFEGRTFEPRLASRRTIIERVRRAAIERRIESTPIIETVTPLDALRADMADGRQPRLTETVTETVRHSPSVRADGRIEYRRSRIEASGAMVAIERLHRAYSNERQYWNGLMRIEPHGEGRGTVGGIERIPGAVNGTETRVSPRWQGSRRADITTIVVARDESSGLLVERQAPVDWRCYSVKPDGTREPFTIERKSSASRKTKVSTIAALQALATTTGHVEAVTSS